MSKNQNSPNLNIIIHQRNIIIHSTSKCSQMLNYFRTSSPSTHPSTRPNPLQPRHPICSWVVMVSMVAKAKAQVLVVLKVENPHSLKVGRWLPLRRSTMDFWFSYVYIYTTKRHTWNLKIPFFWKSRNIYTPTILGFHVCFQLCMIWNLNGPLPSQSIVQESMDKSYWWKQSMFLPHNHHAIIAIKCKPGNIETCFRENVHVIELVKTTPTANFLM